MPKVPMLRPGQIQTRGFSTARLTTDAPVEAFGGGQQKVVKALGGVAGEVVDLVQKEKSKADRTNVRIQSADARQTMNEFLKGKGGYLSTSGLAADETKEQYQKDFYKRLDDFDSKITNDRQRELWEEEKASIRLAYDNAAENHAFRERKVYTENKLKDSITNTQNDISLNYKEPNSVEAGISRQKQLVNDLADMQGLSAESRKRLLDESVSKTHFGVVSQMLSDGNDRLAKAYFKESKSELTSEDKLRVQSMVEEGSVRGESQRQTDSIMGLGLSQQEALAKAREIKEPEVRDETVRRVRQRFAENKAVEESAQQTLFQESFNKIDKDPRREAIPEETWQRLTPSRQKVLTGLIDAKRRGKSITTDWTKYYDIKTQASTPALKDKFLKRDLIKERLNLEDAEFKELVRLQADLRAGKGEAQLQLDGYRSDKQVVDDTLRAAGFDLRSTNENDLKKINQFRAEVDRRVADHKQRIGKKYIDNKELQQIVDTMLVEGTDPESGVFGFFQTKKRAFELKPGEQFDLDVDSIPQSERNKIEEALKRRKIPIDDEAIINLYLKKNAGRF